MIPALHEHLTQTPEDRKSLPRKAGQASGPAPGRLVRAVCDPRHSRAGLRASSCYHASAPRPAVAGTSRALQKNQRLNCNNYLIADRYFLRFQV